ncbi:MAG: HAD family phosphatase [Alphaproteobacteria bacterium]|nr:HAD family phosphatase [Alphaproteobacteria bacterium]
MNPSIVVFDFGGVLVDWDPRRVYQHLLPDMAAIEDFLATVCTPEWNVKQDAGRSIADAEAELIARFPDKAHLIRAYYAGHEVAVGGAVQGTVDLLERLHAKNVPLYGLTNWSGETFPRSRWRFAFMERFRHIVVSGDEKLIKPDPAIYRTMLKHIGAPAEQCLFIDDSPKNVAGAKAVGMHAVHFQSPAKLEADLKAFGLL